jgi:hypothetical protein
MTKKVQLTLGRTVITAAAQATLNPEDVLSGLRRHASGDWGDVPQDDAAANDRAVGQDLRILSTYTDRAGVRFWIITEADRSATTILLPEDY